MIPPDFFFTVGRNVETWFLSKWGVWDINETTWQTYLDHRLWPTLDPVLVGVLLALCLPFFFLFARCCCCPFHSKLGRALLYIIGGLGFVAMLVVGAFSLTAMRFAGESFQDKILPPIMTQVYPLTQANLTFLASTANTYDLPSVAQHVTAFQSTFSSDFSQVQRVVDVSSHGAHGFVIGVIALLAFSILLSLLVFLFSKSCARGVFAVFACFLFVLLGFCCAAFIATGFLSVDGVHRLGGLRTQYCPTQQTFQPDYDALNAAITAAKTKLGQNPPPSQRTQLQAEIQAATKSIAILQAFQNCDGGYRILKPSLDELTDSVTPVIFFQVTAIVGAMSVLAVLFLVAVCFGICHRPHHDEYEPVDSDYRPKRNSINLGQQPKHQYAPVAGSVNNQPPAYPAYQPASTNVYPTNPSTNPYSYPSAPKADNYGIVSKK